MLPERIVINDRLSIPKTELQLSFAKSGGPGGQHVNKVNSKVFLRWNFTLSSSIEEWMIKRIEDRCGTYTTEQGELLLSSTQHRKQSMNIDECVEKLTSLLKDALQRKKSRKKTRVPRAVKEKRLDGKKKKSQKKKMRSKINY